MTADTPRETLLLRQELIADRLADCISLHGTIVVLGGREMHVSFTRGEIAEIVDSLRLAVKPADDDVREDDLCEMLRQFIMEFWIDKPQMVWKRTLCDDGLEMVHHAGDTIFFGDPNHKEPSDTARFDLIVQLANSTPRLLRALATKARP